MVATTCVAPNRIAPYLSEPTNSLPPLPVSAAGRTAVMADAVLHALVALQGQLVHTDPKVVQAAAGMILDFEKTRLRHGRHVVGTEPWVAEQEPHTECANNTPDHTPEPDPLADLPAEPDDGQIEAVRKAMQKRADEKGTGEVVTWGRAKQAAREGIALIRSGFRDGDHRRAAGATDEKDHRCRS